MIVADELPINEDEEFGTKALQEALSLDPCGRFHEVTKIVPATLPHTHWWKVRYLGANGNLCHIIIVFSEDGSIVTSYTGTSLFGSK